MWTSPIECDRYYLTMNPRASGDTTFVIFTLTVKLNLHLISHTDIHKVTEEKTACWNVIEKNSVMPVR